MTTQTPKKRWSFIGASKKKPSKEEKAENHGKTQVKSASLTNGVKVNGTKAGTNIGPQNGSTGADRAARVAESGNGVKVNSKKGRGFGKDKATLEELWERAPKPEMPPDEEERIAYLRSLKILDSDFDDTYDRITRFASSVFNMPIALISLVDTNRQWFKSCVGVYVSETSRQTAFCAYTIHSNSPLIVPETLTDHRFRHNPLVTGPPYIRFYAGAPLVCDGQYRVGTLCLIDTRPRELTKAEVNNLKDLASIVAKRLELAWFSENQSLVCQNLYRQRNQLLKAVSEISDAICMLSVVNGKSSVTFCNDTFVGLTSFQKNRVIGRPLGILLNLHDEDSALLLAKMATDDVIEMDVKTRNGNRYHIKATNSKDPSLPANMNAYFVLIGTIEDGPDPTYTTAIKRMKAEETLWKQSSFMEQSSLRMRQHIYNIYGASKILQDMVGSNPEVSEVVNMLLESCTTAEKEVDMVQTVSRLTDSQADYGTQVEFVNIWQMLEKASETAQRTIDKQQLYLYYIVSEDVSKELGVDNDKLAYIVGQCLQLAADRSPYGSDLKVSVSVCQAESFLNSHSTLGKEFAGMHDEGLAISILDLGDTLQSGFMKMVTRHTSISDLAAQGEDAQQDEQKQTLNRLRVLYTLLTRQGGTLHVAEREDGQQGCSMTIFAPIVKDSEKGSLTRVLKLNGEDEGTVRDDTVVVNAAASDQDALTNATSKSSQQQDEVSNPIRINDSPSENDECGHYTHGRFVIVSENEPLSQMLTSYLSYSGHEVYSRATAHDAIAKLAVLNTDDTTNTTPSTMASAALVVDGTASSAQQLLETGVKMIVIVDPNQPEQRQTWSNIVNTLCIDHPINISRLQNAVAATIATPMELMARPRTSTISSLSQTDLEGQSRNSSIATTGSNVQEPQANSSDAVPHLNIGIFEPDSVKSMILVKMIEGLGHDVAVASDSRALIRLFESRQQNILLVALPDQPTETDVQFMEEINAALSRQPGTPILAMCNKPTMYLESQVREYGMEMILRKPVSKTKLRDALFEIHKTHLS
eukprot:Clim_evm29s247 gene=Clim_evmTU29s247